MTKRPEYPKFIFALSIMINVVMLTGTLLSGCTVSFNNIRTQGEADDLVDETLSNDPNVSPTITANLPLPTASIKSASTASSK